MITKLSYPKIQDVHEKIKALAALEADHEETTNRIARITSIFDAVCSGLIEAETIREQRFDSRPHRSEIDAARLEELGELIDSLCIALLWTIHDIVHKYNKAEPKFFTDGVDNHPHFKGFADDPKEVWTLDRFAEHVLELFDKIEEQHRLIVAQAALSGERPHGHEEAERRDFLIEARKIVLKALENSKKM